MFLLLSGTLSSLFGFVFRIIPLLVAYSAYVPDQNIMANIVDHPTKLLWAVAPFFMIASIIALVRIIITGEEK
jgi:uncharacterized protein